MKTSLHSLRSSWSLVMCFHGAAKLTAALPPQQNDIVGTLSLSPITPPPFSGARLFPLLFFARSLAAQTAQLSSVPPLPQQILHELCVSEGDGTFKGECNLQGQSVCTSPLLSIPPPFPSSHKNNQCQGLLRTERPLRANVTHHPLTLNLTPQQKMF